MSVTNIVVLIYFVFFVCTYLLKNIPGVDGVAMPKNRNGAIKLKEKSKIKKPYTTIIEIHYI